MPNLTPYLVQKTIKNNKRVDQRVDYDEPDKAIIYLAEGYTWNANDGNRSVEGFILDGNEWEPADTVAYLKERLSCITKIV